MKRERERIGAITRRNQDMSVWPALMLLLLAAIGWINTAEAAAPKDPCGLLKVSEVSAAFPGAKTGKVDTTRQEYGIIACEWPTARSRFVVQFWDSAGSSAKEEASGLMLGVIDPLKPGAGNNIRYETITDVGDAAVAAVEARDDKRGILSDLALLVVKKGDKILVLLSSELARGDRAKALAALKSLGQSSAARL